MVEIKTLEIAFETDSAKGSWKIITPAKLRKIKLDIKDIKKVEPAYFSIPGDLYEEQNVASRFHPCAGSIGVYVVGTDGVRRSIEEIFYYDYNINQNHYNGKPHWNHETRLNDGHKPWRVKNVEYHQIPDSPSIRIMIRDSKGSIIQERTIERAPLGKIRQKQ